MSYKRRIGLDERARARRFRDRSRATTCPKCKLEVSRHGDAKAALARHQARERCAFRQRVQAAGMIEVHPDHVELYGFPGEFVPAWGEAWVTQEIMDLTCELLEASTRPERIKELFALGLGAVRAEVAVVMLARTA